MNAIVVTPADSAPEHVDLNLADFREIQRIVGGSFCSCFTVPGAGRNRRVVGWCRDDFLLLPPEQRPGWNVFLDPDRLYRGGCAIGGPIVIMAHYGPETVPLSELEAAAFRFARDKRWIGTVPTGELLSLPVLTFIPGYDV
jgi:hypothetical protein